MLVTAARGYLLLAALLALPLFGRAAAQDTTKDENRIPTGAYFGRFWGDLKELPTKPFHWSGKQWLIAGGVTGASLAAFSVDDKIRQHYNNHRSGFFASVSDVTTHFGDYRMQIPLLLGCWTGGVVTQNETLYKISADGIESSIIAAGIINPAIVIVSGRALPDAGENALAFKPFSQGRYSYPSGHTAAAFSLATVIDQNLRSEFGYWQTPVVYGMAIGTAHSRIYDYTHYLSDVIMGAGIGTAVGYWISNKPRNKERTAYIIPTLNGVFVAVKF